MPLDRCIVKDGQFGLDGGYKGERDKPVRTPCSSASPFGLLTFIRSDCSNFAYCTSQPAPLNFPPHPVSKQLS